jgi:1,4-alpha-glucan branching enzyme
MLFMGQEFLEDKHWADDFVAHRDLLLHWAGLAQGDAQMLDHLRFTRELLAARWQHPALRGQGFRVVHADDAARVLAFQRWVPDKGHDVIVVAHLATRTRVGYRVGFPHGGTWREVFNSDVYEAYPNPSVADNGDRVEVESIPWHGLAYSAALVLPANGLLIFAR